MVQQQQYVFASIEIMSNMNKLHSELRVIVSYLFKKKIFGLCL
jgi:hypothetical protein